MVLVFLLVLVLEAVFLFQAFVVFPYTDFLASILPNVLVDLTNDSRQTAELHSLKISPLLEKAAQMKAEDMADKGYFAHISPEGITPWHWLEEAEYEFSYAGENLAVNFFDSKSLNKAWLNSPTHRANIINKNFTEIGIGIANGIYKGKETVFVVQFFGTPSSKTGIAKEPVVSGKISEGNESFIVLEGGEDDSEKVLGALAIEELKYSNSATKLFSIPRTIANCLLLILIVIVSFSLILGIFVKIRIQFPGLIFNGFLLLLVIGLSFWINQYFVSLIV